MFGIRMEEHKLKKEERKLSRTGPLLQNSTVGLANVEEHHLGHF